jgi:hypothetical protein
MYAKAIGSNTYFDGRFAGKDRSNGVWEKWSIGKSETLELASIIPFLTLGPAQSRIR